MDLANYNLSADADNGYALTILDPYNGKPTDIVINIIGADSKTYRTAKTNAYRESMQGKDADEISAKIYASCVTGWQNVVKDGKEIGFSPEKAFDLFCDLNWLMDQVGAAVEKRANFMKKPVKA